MRTILFSIDGGGIKGIIPATVLEHLDEALKAKDPNTALAYYFDMIAGTSTGGLITALLASQDPKDPNHHGFTPAEIVKFYMDNGPQIFNYSRPGHGATFDGEFLHNITREILQDTRLSDTLTHVVIPTFDVKTKKPVIFSNYKVSITNYPSLNAKMSDICIGTSAAPQTLPPYQFENDGTEFNLIDGGVAAGNPTQSAVSEGIRYNSFGEIHVLSLGTGVTTVIEQYDAEIVGRWSQLDWLYKGPEFLVRASTDMTENYLATVFPSPQPTKTYLRVEEYDLPDFLDKTVNAKKENMDNLEQVGKDLLKKNVDSFDIEETGDGTYAEALDRFAEILYNERQHRLKTMSMEKRGRPFIQNMGVPFGQAQAA
ncbi:patatin-like protein 2 [Abrus precatorius]|uniref:Patatin n=1 Tax=Abrus precatorius TaxID=3816 RepID=A0A8B8K299_ABRPR|nr:patatin-like protein 2 [Abrus precatorius]